VPSQLNGAATGALTTPMSAAEAAVANSAAMAVVAMKILDRFVIASSPCGAAAAPGLIDATAKRMMARAPRPAKQSHHNETSF
jgi:hypothetical protein